MQPFSVPVDLDHEDLLARLERTRFPVGTPGSDWARGTPPAFLRRLVDHWLHRYDWSAAAERLNRHPHASADLAAGRLHFVRHRNPGAPACSSESTVLL